MQRPSADPSRPPCGDSPQLSVPDDFLETFAHDLRNPLSAIVGWIDVLGSIGDGRVAPAVQALRRAVDQQDQTLTRMLDLAALHNGGVALECARHPLQRVAERAVATARVPAERKRVTLTLQVTEHLPPVLGDRLRLEQILLALLDHGIHNAREGGAVAAALEREGDRLRFGVTDSGRGLRAADCAARAALLRQPGGPVRGIGIALATARELAHLHGAHIEVQSDGLGRGSRYSLSIPAAEAD